MNKQQAVVSDDVIALLKEKYKSAEGVHNITGLSRQFSKALLEGQPIPRKSLDVAICNLKGQFDGTMGLRLSAIKGTSVHRFRHFMNQMRSCAEMLDKYYGLFRLGARESECMFPPRRAVAVMHLAFEEALETLRMIVKDAPQYFEYLCGDLPNLRDLITTKEIRKVMAAQAEAASKVSPTKKKRVTINSRKKKRKKPVFTGQVTDRIPGT